MPGKSWSKCHESPQKHMPRKSCPARRKPCFRYSQGMQELPSQQWKNNSAVGLRARSIMSLEFLTHLSQDSLQGIQTQNTFGVKNAVKSCFPYRFVKGRQVEYNATDLRVFLFAACQTPESSCSEHKASCPHLNYLNSGGVTNKEEEDMRHQCRWDRKALRISVTNAMHFLGDCHRGSVSFPVHNLCTTLGISQSTWISTRQQIVQRSMGLTGLLFLLKHKLQIQSQEVCIYNGDHDIPVKGKLTSLKHSKQQIEILLKEA